MNDPRFNERLFAALLPFIMRIAPVGMGWHAVRGTDPSQPPLLVDDDEKVICTATQETMDLAQRVKNWEGGGVSAAQIETLITVICRRLDRGGYPHRWRYRDGNVISCNDEVIAVGLLLEDAERFIQEALRVWGEVLRLEKPLPTYEEVVFKALVPVVTRHFPADRQQWQVWPDPEDTATILHQPSPDAPVASIATLQQSLAEELVERVASNEAEGVPAALTAALVGILIYCLEGTEEYSGHPSRWQYHADNQTLVVSADDSPVAVGLPPGLLSAFLRQATEIYLREYGFDQHTGLTFEPPRFQSIGIRLAELPGAEAVPVFCPQYTPEVQLALQLLISFCKLRREIVPFDLLTYFGGIETPPVERPAFAEEFHFTAFMGAFVFLSQTGWVILDLDEATARLSSRALQRLEYFQAKHSADGQNPTNTAPGPLTGPGSCTR